MPGTTRVPVQERTLCAMPLGVGTKRGAPRYGALALRRHVVWVCLPLWQIDPTW